MLYFVDNPNPTQTWLWCFYPRFDLSIIFQFVGFLRAPTSSAYYQMVKKSLINEDNENIEDYLKN